MSELSDLLREARAMIRDMDYGWPTKELHRPPEDLCAVIHQDGMEKADE